jgi:hypothetical protein
VGYGLVIKSYGVRCTFEEVKGKCKMSKDECESFLQPNLDESFDLVSRRKFP